MGQCDNETEDLAAKRALKSKCDAILESAPAAPMRLYSIEDHETKNRLHLRGTGISFSHALGFLGLTVSLLSVGMFLRTLRSSHTQQAEDRQTSKDFLEDEGIE